MAEQFQKIKNNINFFLKIIFVLFFVYFIFDRLVSIEQAIYIIKKANYLFIVIALLLGVLNIYLQYKRWHIISRIALHTNDKEKAFKSLMIGLSGGVITPMRVGEIVGRNVLYPNVDIYTIGFASYVDKLFPLILTLVIGFISANIFINAYYTVPDYAIYLADGLYLIFISLLIAVIFSKRIFKFVVEKIAFFKKFHNIINNTKQFKNVRVQSILYIAGVTFLYYLCLLLQYSVLVIAFSHKFDILNYIFAASILFFVLSLSSPLTISGIGVREITSIYVLSKFNISNEAAFSTSVYLFMINLLIPSIIGMFIFLNHKKDTNV